MLTILYTSARLHSLVAAVPIPLLPQPGLSNASYIYPCRQIEKAGN